MHYPVPAGYSTNNIVVGANMVLSEKDKSWIARYYPHPPPGAGSFSFTPRGGPKEIPLAYTYPAASPPDITLALTSLDVSRDMNPRVSAQVANFHQASCDIHLHSGTEALEHRSITPISKSTRAFSTSATNSDTQSPASKSSQPNSGFNSAGATWLETPSDGRIFKVGVCNAECNYRGIMDHSQDITFPSPYLDSDPVVIVWLNSIHCRSGPPTKIKISTSNISINGFRIHIKSSGGSVFASAGASWVAYPRGMPGTRTGNIEPIANPENRRIEFPNNTFTQTPNVLLAVNELNFNRGVPVRFDLATYGVEISEVMLKVSPHVGATYLALAS